MAGDLKRVASKAGTMNGSKDMRGSRVLWLLCLVDDGTQRRLDENADGVLELCNVRFGIQRWHSVAQNA